MVKSMETLFENLKAIAAAVAETFGQPCEVVVHDLKNLDHSLIYLAGNVTGRRLGAPITDLVLKVLKEQGDNAKDLIGYKNILHDGRILKSSTIFIRDDRGKIVAALCINYDLTDLMNISSFLHDFIRLGKDQQEESETFTTSVQETIEALVNEAVAVKGKQPATMQTKDKVKMVGLLEERGAFLIKGSVDYVARVLGVSKFTVYNYLQKIRSFNELSNGNYIEEEGKHVRDNKHS